MNKVYGNLLDLIGWFGFYIVWLISYYIGIFLNWYVVGREILNEFIIIRVWIKIS